MKEKTNIYRALEFQFNLQVRQLARHESSLQQFGDYGFTVAPKEPAHIEQEQEETTTTCPPPGGAPSTTTGMMIKVPKAVCELLYLIQLRRAHQVRHDRAARGEADFPIGAWKTKLRSLVRTGTWLYVRRRCEILKSRIAEGPDEDEDPGISSDL